MIFFKTLTAGDLKLEILNSIYYFINKNYTFFYSDEIQKVTIQKVIFKPKTCFIIEGKEVLMLFPKCSIFFQMLIYIEIEAYFLVFTLYRAAIGYGTIVYF